MVRLWPRVGAAGLGIGAVMASVPPACGAAGARIQSSLVLTASAAVQSPCACWARMCRGTSAPSLISAGWKSLGQAGVDAHCSVLLSHPIPSYLPPDEAEDIKVCPRCSAFIMKINDGSCNRMNCTVCGCLFCWLCLREISDVHFLRSAQAMGLGALAGAGGWDGAARPCPRFGVSWGEQGGLCCWVWQGWG